MIARVYTAINAVAAALAEDGVAKTRLNARDQYLYRSIDDVLERLAPLLAHHRLCILPRVLERHAGDRIDESGALLVAVNLKVAFDLVSAEDGSCHTIKAYGEALDAGDKATPKAMQSAYKYAVLQAFCVPAVQQEDADARSYRLQAVPAASVHSVAQPPQGWRAWCDEVVARLEACGSVDALQRLKEDARPLLKALQREAPGLYQQVGEAFAACGTAAETSKKTPASTRVDAADQEPTAAGGSTGSHAGRGPIGIGAAPPGPATTSPPKGRRSAKPCSPSVARNEAPSLAVAATAGRRQSSANGSAVGA